MAQATSMILMVSIAFKFLPSDGRSLLFLTTYFSLFFSSVIAMTWAYEDCDRPLKVVESRAEYALHLKERLLEEEGKKKKVDPGS